MTLESRQMELDAHTSSLALLQRAQLGDSVALDALLRRYLGPLTRWAHGRLPVWAREGGDTEDAVQDVIVKAVRLLPTLELPNEGAFHAYLRQAVRNRVLDAVRNASRRPPHDPLTSGEPDRQSSPLDEAIGTQALDRYEEALGRLRQEERDAVIARIEFELSYDEVARVLSKPSANAARMFVTRALIRLAEEMQA